MTTSYLPAYSMLASASSCSCRSALSFLSLPAVLGPGALCERLTTGPSILNLVRGRELRSDAKVQRRGHGVGLHTARSDVGGIAGAWGPPR